VPLTTGWSNEGESEAHRRLKEYVCGNPQLLFGQRAGWRGDPEYVLASADRVDVLFRGHGRTVSVEVKAYNANDADVSRGIFQCVKYRAVFRAHQTAQGELPNGEAMLVVQRPITDALQALAELLGVPFVSVERDL